MNEQKNMMVEDQKRFVLPQMIGMDGGDDDLADDMEGLQLSFPQIKVPGGGSLVWELPSGDPAEPELGEVPGGCDPVQPQQQRLLAGGQRIR